MYQFIHHIFDRFRLIGKSELRLFSDYFGLADDDDFILFGELEVDLHGQVFTLKKLFYDGKILGIDSNGGE
jgi:hypothetical protein